jgi:hypothetical protein
MRLDGRKIETVLDFATTPALAKSGGPEGLSFDPATGELFFNTNLSAGPLPHTGVWRISGGVPQQVIPDFASVNTNVGARNTAFLPSGRLVAGLDYPTPPRIAYRDPDLLTGFAGPPQTPANLFKVFPDEPPFDHDTPGAFPPTRTLAGLAVNNAGTTLFFTSNKRDDQHGGGDLLPGTIFMIPYGRRVVFAPTSCGSLPVVATTCDRILGPLAFDGVGNLYVAAKTPDGINEILRFYPNGSHDVFAPAPLPRGNAGLVYGIAICNQSR